MENVLEGAGDLSPAAGGSPPHIYDDVRETNNVAHGSFNGPIDTRLIVHDNPSATFNKNKLGGCGFNLVHPPLASVSLHRSGRFSIMGTKSRVETTLAVVKLKHLIQKYHRSIKFSPTVYTINNVVCCGHVAPINLTLMQNTWPHAVRYDPINFKSAAVISCRSLGIPDTNVHVFAFESGKCNIIGAKSREQADSSFAQTKILVLDKVRIRDSMVTDASKPAPLIEPVPVNIEPEVEQALSTEEENEYINSMIAHMQI